MANKVLWQEETIASLATTELNSLANAAEALGAEYDNRTNQFRWGDLELVFGTGSNPVAGTFVRVWLLTMPDNTNYEDGSSSVEPQKPPDAVFIVRASTAQRIVIKRVPIPPSKIKALVGNETGQAFSASANTLKLLPYNEEVQ